jgi:hypothetical protein
MVLWIITFIVGCTVAFQTGEEDEENINIDYPYYSDHLELNEESKNYAY